MKSAYIAVLMAVSAFCWPCSAEQVIPDGRWYSFSFFAPDVSAAGCAPADASDEALDCIQDAYGFPDLAPGSPWTFSSPGNAMFEITDAFRYGDMFEVLDNGASVLFTPAVASSQNGCGGGPDACLGDPLSSHGSVILSSGFHSLDVVPRTVTEPGLAFMRVTSIAEAKAPEDHTIRLLASTVPLLFGLALWKRTRRSHRA